MAKQDRVLIFDTTLRDGEQCPGASLNQREKIEIAQQLARLNVDVIEAGFPIASPDDFRAVKAIAETIKGPRIAGLARCLNKDIERCAEAVMPAGKRARIHVFLATSKIHRDFKLRKNKTDILKQATLAVRYARTLCDDVEFSPEDATRTERDYLAEVVRAVIDAGAATVNIPDTVGYTVPTEFGALIGYLFEHVPNIGKAVINVHCHNDLGLATANTLAGIKAGARQAEVTMNGIGERAGNTSLEEVVMALHTRGDLMKLETSINSNHIHPTSRLTSMITGIVVQPNKAIVGANAFAHEAGIHQDGVLKNPMTYEIMEPESVGLAGNNLVLGKHSGRHAFRDKLAQMGYELSKKELDQLFRKFKELADKRKEILEEDIEALVAEEILRVPDVYELDYLNVVSGTVAVPTATVKLKIRGKEAQGAGFGVGPIDAAFNTIAKMTGSRTKLMRFSVNAITGGMDAQGEVTVRLQENGLLALGKGSDSDIITASAKAYVNGLNRLEYLRNNPRLSPDETLR